MAETPTLKVSVVCDKEHNLAKFSVTRGNDDFAGEYTREDAGVHEGEIITAQNYLSYLGAIMPSVPSAPPAQATITFTANDAKASVVVKFEIAVLGKAFTDTVTVMCPRVEVAEVDKKARATAQELAALHAEIAEVRAALNEERAIAAIESRWGRIPHDGREFYIELIKRALGGNPVMLPVVGPDFIRIGARYFACDFGGIKTHNVICCTEPQNYSGNLDTDGLRETAMLDVATGSDLQRWIAQQARRRYFELSEAMLEHARTSLAVVGRGEHTIRPLYFAISPNVINRQGEGAPVSYIEYTAPSTEPQFALPISRGFKLYYDSRDKRAASRTPIIAEFATACTATASLITLAESSGLKPYVMKPRASTDVIPAHP